MGSTRRLHPTRSLSSTFRPSSSLPLSKPSRRASTGSSKITTPAANNNHNLSLNTFLINNDKRSISDQVLHGLGQIVSHNVLISRITRMVLRVRYLTYKRTSLKNMSYIWCTAQIFRLIYTYSQLFQLNNIVTNNIAVWKTASERLREGIIASKPASFIFFIN